MTTETAEKTTETDAAPIRSIDTLGVQAAIPHRYPFLLVDKVDIFEENKRAVGTKCVTINEEFFNGHFPGQPIMPGVLVIEALAQTACVMLLSAGGFENKIAFFLGIESAKFRKPVMPGDVLKLEIEVLKLGGRAGKFKGKAYVDGKLATEAQMSFVLADKK
ncbi:MAG: 3-hydroxyacyl-[acyl-carrier-protein] dehydratase FabZ [Elusimicrobia bacterium]|nr:MAG: 3-hydroxyacyl-[acyl-carrier-protein] dehydratase FabZ [Elusimicrobiota bacterium]